jgi:hypothetical protein
MNSASDPGDSKHVESVIEFLHDYGAWRTNLLYRLRSAHLLLATGGPLHSQTYRRLSGEFVRKTDLPR